MRAKATLIRRDAVDAPLPCTLEDAVAEVRRLRSRVVELEGLLERQTRAAKRQAAPHSRGTHKADPCPPGRKPGAAYGPKARRPIPGYVDEHIEIPLPGVCPDCGGELEETGVHVTHEEELPPPTRPHVTQFRTHAGRCRDCGRSVRPTHPRQSSVAVGAASTHLGPRAVGMAAYLNKALGIPHAKVAGILEAFTGLRVTAGGVVHALHRATRRAEPTYGALIEAVRQSPMVSPDETGWRIDGHSAWMWAFACMHVTVYRIASGRGFVVAAAVLGEDYDGVMCRDGWASYRRFTAARHQTCYAHLLRRCAELLELARGGQAHVPRDVKALLKDALELRDRRDAGDISQAELRAERQDLERRADALVARWHVSYPPNVRLLDHLERERAHLFTFLDIPGVDATNFRSEQALRPAVCARKHWGGNKTWAGAHATEVLASVLRTAAQQHLDPVGVLAGIVANPNQTLAPFTYRAPTLAASPGPDPPS